MQKYHFACTETEKSSVTKPVISHKLLHVTGIQDEVIQVTVQDSNNFQKFDKKFDFLRLIPPIY